ncbi:MAG: hypothetical protein AAF628_35100 [Planctomycetota bacterium]
MRVAVVDPSSVGLGLALGLIELGHKVAYTPGVRPAGVAPGPADGFVDQLVERVLGGARRLPDPSADLLVFVDAWSGGLQALERREQHGAPFDPNEALLATVNPAMYPHRLRSCLELLGSAPRVAVIDVSDQNGPREPVFEGLAGVTLLAREVRLADAGSPWSPWPYLYNPAMLWLEWLCPRANWFIPRGRRSIDLDWVFCGVVDHPRYGGRRRARLAEIRQRFPAARSRVPPLTTSFTDVVRLLQASAAGLDLPGTGEICFRLHEALALDVPMLRPWPFTVHLPAGLSDAFVAAPGRATQMPPGAVRALYEAYYAPACAAQSLLDAVASTPTSPRPVAGALAGPA